MTMTDPVADMLARIRNASQAHHDVCTMPSSKIKETLAALLVDEGYLESYEVEQTKPQATLHIRMKYGSNRERVLTGLRRVSKPGLRVYVKKDEIPRVRNGLGLAVITTPRGLLTDRQARRAGVGGEVICHVW